MKKYDVIGLMSGTSMDGLDIAYVRFTHDTSWAFQVMQTETITYDSDLLNKLKHAPELDALDLKKLDLHFGKWIGKKVRNFMEVHHISPELIVSHGHTVFHQPEIGLTLQIGDGHQILNATKVKTVCDLRSLDVALGGQGAPLVPIGDKLLFHAYDFCLNLGGFSNISYDKNDLRIAYDICPVNTILNKLATELHLEYDDGGAIARSGIVNNKILQEANLLTYYDQKPPKSLGIEWVIDTIFPMLQSDTPENLLTTFSHHIADQIIASIKKSQKSSDKNFLPKMLVTGGGAKNTFLMELINDQAKGLVEVIVPEIQIIDFKEAIIFAFLGLLKTRGEINTLRSVTGARSDSSGGIIYDSIC